MIFISCSGSGWSSTMLLNCGTDSVTIFFEITALLSLFPWKDSIVRLNGLERLKVPLGRFIFSSDLFRGQHIPRIFLGYLFRKACSFLLILAGNHNGVLFWLMCLNFINSSTSGKVCSCFSLHYSGILHLFQLLLWSFLISVRIGFLFVAFSTDSILFLYVRLYKSTLNLKPGIITRLTLVNNSAPYSLIFFKSTG